MAKIAVLIDKMFEDAEYAEPVRAFLDAGHQVVNVGLKKGKAVSGKRNKERAIIDESAGSVMVGDFDALLIPGGFSPDYLRADETAVRFTREFVLSGKPVFIICHAPQLLITAGVLRGRKVAGWMSIAVDVKNAGAEFIDSAVVGDGNIISSRGPDDIPQFVDAALRKLTQISEKIIA